MQPRQHAEPERGYVPCHVAFGGRLAIPGGVPVGQPWRVVVGRCVPLAVLIGRAVFTAAPSADPQGRRSSLSGTARCKAIAMIGPLWDAAAYRAAAAKIRRR